MASQLLIPPLTEEYTLRASAKIIPALIITGTLLSVPFLSYSWSKFSHIQTMRKTASSDTGKAAEIEIPQAARELLQDYLKEVASSLDLPLDESRTEGFLILEKYFSPEFSARYLMPQMIKGLGSELNSTASNALISPQTPENKMREALVRAVLQENAWHLFIGVFRSIRQLEREGLSSSSIFLDESLRTFLLNHPLTFSISQTGSTDFNPETKETFYVVQVTVMPELKKFDKSVEMTFTIAQSKSGAYYIRDSHEMKGVSTLALYYDTSKSLLRRTLSAKWPISQPDFEKPFLSALQNYKIDEEEWKDEAQDLLNKDNKAEKPAQPAASQPKTPPPATEKGSKIKRRAR